MKVSVVVPTVPGREDYLARCLDGYQERTDCQIEEVIIPNEFSGGAAWQLGAEYARGDFLHLTNDDIVPGENWLEPCVRATESCRTPVVTVVTCTEDVLDPKTKMPLAGNPLNEHATHYEGVPRVQKPGTLVNPNNRSEYPSLPFCTIDQWTDIGPMIPTQYGTDKWFGYRAQQVGIECVCVESVFYHYAAFVGRDNAIDGWLGVDRLTFDQNIALPLYESGALPVDQLHPEWDTIEGREMSRRWYEANVSPPYPWEGS